MRTIHLFNQNVFILLRCIVALKEQLIKGSFQHEKAVNVQDVQYLIYMYGQI